MNDFEKKLWADVFCVMVDRGGRSDAEGAANAAVDAFRKRDAADDAEVTNRLAVIQTIVEDALAAQKTKK